ncbi:MAG: winged helix-turn-helix domain-containing protein [Sphingobium sp.]|nr:winged helix-turn-helix domain-containing protein [Sphingobium sp.]
MAEADRVELAHEPDFTLGRLTISPVRRTLLREDGTQDVLEHRVMQVLIALAKAKGGIVTRDELTQSCWESRVVGEDAINRVISRLRRSAETIGKDSFRIETVTKIGYRLIALDADGKASAPIVASVSSPAPPLASRRAVIGGVIALGSVGVAVGGTLLYRKLSTPAVPPEVATLIAQGRVASAQGVRDGANEAIGLFRHVTEIAPDYADGWGLLGFAYARAAYFRPKGEYEAMRERARAVAARALQLDPNNSYGLIAQALAVFGIGHWIESEKLARRALIGRPDEEVIIWVLGMLMNQVGRFGESIALFDRIQVKPRPPTSYYQNIVALWGAGRFDRLDKMTAEAAALYPTQFAIWFSRLYILLYGGQIGAAISMAEDVENRPSSVSADEFDRLLDVAHAAQSRDPATIDRVMQVQMALAHQGNGPAENALQFACLFGKLDEAFAIADAYYFDRGFTVPELRFGSQGSYTPKDSRFTHFLFMPSTKPMRADPRFNRLTEELGLDRYWQEAGGQPDFRRT